MPFSLSTLMLALFGASLILITLALWLLRGTPQADQPPSTPARFFLIVLRLAIGWHCFFEGMEKFSTPNWSSEGYLRESMGPLAEVYRDVAGDSLIDKLTVGKDNAFPPRLEREWREYLQAFAAHHALTEEQIEQAKWILDLRKMETLAYLLSKQEVAKIAPYPPELKMDMTMKQRLQEHERLLQKVRDLEAEFPTTEKDTHEKWKRAKADLAKWRGELKKSLEEQTKKLKDALAVPAPVAFVSAIGSAAAPGSGPLATAAALYPGGTGVLTVEQKQRPMPASSAAQPMKSWNLLEWSDFAVKWSLAVFGAGLMLGLFSRISSLALALLVLSFYLAMPALPGWPESPRLEGHYVYINKTLIEVVALLALACIPTGRWAGLDGLLQFFRLRQARR